MIKNWFLNLILFISLALNVTLGAAWLGREFSTHPARQPQPVESTQGHAYTIAEGHQHNHKQQSVSRHQPPSSAGQDKGHRRQEPQRMTFRRLKSLPEEHRSTALGIFRKEEPQLRSYAQNLRHTRREAYAYLASPEYNREEAERRFVKMRIVTLATLRKSQDMLMDIADTLPLEQRRQLVPQAGALRSPQEQGDASQPDTRVDPEADERSGVSPVTRHDNRLGPDNRSDNRSSSRPDNTGAMQKRDDVRNPRHFRPQSDKP